MTKRLYTRPLVLPIVGDTPFTPEEHARVYQAEWENHFASTQNLLRWYLQVDGNKLSAAGFLIGFAARVRVETIVSFGAGPAVIEYVTSMGLPSPSLMLATDFDPWLVQRTGDLLPGIHTALFDLYYDDPAELVDSAGRPPDMAIFLGSSYVMEDARFIEFFRRLGEVGVHYVVDFQAGYLPLMGWARAQAARLIRRHPPADAKFHGFARTRLELRRIYRASGLRIESESAVGPYRYVAVLTP
jgi:hypothetical protein